MGRSEATIQSLKKSLIIEFPAGDDKLQASSRQDILWTCDKNIREVKLEYSTDNGSTYRTIVAGAPNTGRYEWEAPHDLLSSCLIRISETNGQPALPDVYSFEMDFKISSNSALVNSGQSLDFLIRIMVPDRIVLDYQRMARLSFIPGPVGEKKESV